MGKLSGKLARSRLVRAEGKNACWPSREGHRCLTMRWLRLPGVIAVGLGRVVRHETYTGIEMEPENLGEPVTDLALAQALHKSELLR